MDVPVWSAVWSVRGLERAWGELMGVPVWMSRSGCWEV